MSITEVLNSVLKKLEEEQKQVMLGWAQGAYTGKTMEETVQLNSKALGVLEGIHVSGCVVNELLEEMEAYDN